MQYEWDENKRIANIARHSIDFRISEDFEWDSAIETRDDRFDFGEERWIAIGLIRGKVHVLVYTTRGQNIRIISLRRANSRERNYYES